MQLRKLTFEAMHNNVGILDLEVVFQGTRDECVNYANLIKDVVWKDSRKYLFGGYWFSPSKIIDGELIENYCLIPT